MVKVVFATCSACSCGGLIFGIIALALSFKTLEQGKYALGLDWTTQKIDEEVYSKPGLMFVGFGNMLIEYPSTFQSMYFVSSSRGIAGGEQDIMRGAIRARSQDGLEMQVSVSFQWKLDPSALKPLFAILGGGDEEGENLYRDEFVRFARAALVESCSEYTAESFFTNRTEITANMFDKVASAFNLPEKGLVLSIKGLQLREVSLPKEFDDEIVETQEQMQEVEVAIADRQRDIIAAERDLAVMEQKIQEMVQVAAGNANETIQINAAEVKQILVLEEKQAIANSKIVEKFDDNFTAGEDPYARLAETMEISAIKSHDSDQVVIDL